MQGECATRRACAGGGKAGAASGTAAAGKWGLASDDAAYHSGWPVRDHDRHRGGLPVFNRQISLRFDGQGGVAVSGLWSFGTPYTTVQASGTVCVASDALLAFAANGQDCTRITSMTIGYRLRRTAAGACS